MSPTGILSGLVVAATVVGAHLYTKHEMRKGAGGEEASVETLNYISALETQVAELEKENQSLRSLATSGATMALPPELVEFVEKDLGLEFVSAPVVREVSEDMIAEAAGQRYLAVFSEVGMQMRAYAFEKMGIVPPSQNFMGQLIAAETNGSRGYFDLTAGEILLAPGFDAENVHHLASAARLLAISLLEQHAELPLDVTDDAFHAHEAVHRGRAAMVQARFYTINAKQLGFVAEKPNEEAIEVFQALAPYVQDLTVFPNTEGKMYVEGLFQRDEGMAEAALLEPTRLSRDILRRVVPADYGELPEVERTEETQLATRLGAVTVLSFLKQVMEVEEAGELVAKFDHDALTLTTSGKKEMTATVEWVTVWESGEAAGAFRKAANEMAAAMETPPRILLDGVEVRMVFVEDGFPVR